MSSDPRNLQRARFCVRSFPPGWKPGSTAGKDVRRYPAGGEMLKKLLKFSGREILRVRCSPAALPVAE
jgi:hypothetical protein